MSLGDSRIYRLREGKLAQLSTDHTYRHPGHIRSALVGYIGTEYEDDFKKMDFYKLEYQKGDKYLLCTDGVTDMVKDEVLEEILQMPVAEARGKMVDEVNRIIRYHIGSVESSFLIVSGRTVFRQTGIYCRIPERVESAQQTVILLETTKNRIRLIPQMPLS